MTKLDQMLVLEPDSEGALSRIGLDALSQATHIASSLTESMGMFSYNRIDLVIISANLCMGDCQSAIRTIRKHAPTTDLIALIDRDCEHGAMAAIEAGVNDYLVVDPAELPVETIKQMVKNIANRRVSTRTNFVSEIEYLRKRNQRLDSLTKVNQELATIHDSSRLIQRLMRTALDVLDAEGCSIWLWADHRKRVLECRAIRHRVDTDTPDLVGTQVVVGNGVVGWVAKYKEGVLLTTVDTDDRFNRAIDLKINFETDSIIAVPLLMKDEVLGVMEFVNRRSGLFEKSDQESAEMLASTAAIALQNARLVEQLRYHTVQLEERNNELDAFGHTLAHDIQNILGRVVGFSEVLALEIEQETPSLPKDQLESIAYMISQNSRKMSDIVDGLLLMAYVRNEEVQFNQLDMSLIAREATNRLAEQIESLSAEVILPDHWPVSVGYAPWVEEIWFNYMSNAIKYGGNPPLLHLGSRVDFEEGMAYYWIDDNGSGSESDEAYAELFQPFKRSSSHTGVTGHGLGLSIVYRIASRLGGTVGAERLPSGGSRFYFSLPIEQNDPITTRFGQIELTPNPV